MKNEDIELKIVMSKEVAANLVELGRLTDSESDAELITKALAVYDTLVLAQLRDEAIYVRNNQGKEKILPLLVSTYMFKKHKAQTG